MSMLKRVWLLLLVVGGSLHAAEQTQPDLNQQLVQLREEVTALKTRVDQLSRKPGLAVNNRYFVRSGFSLILPRESDYSFSTDSGIGFIAGVGRYFGTRHTVTMNLVWDFYLAAALRYQYILLRSPLGLEGGPILGGRMRVVEMEPFDNFVASPSLVDTSFYEVGFALSTVMGGAARLQAEAVYFISSQKALSVAITLSFFI